MSTGQLSDIVTTYATAAGAADRFARLVATDDVLEVLGVGPPVPEDAVGVLDEGFDAAEDSGAATGNTGLLLLEIQQVQIFGIVARMSAVRPLRVLGLQLFVQVVGVLGDSTNDDADSSCRRTVVQLDVHVLQQVDVVRE